MEKTVKLWQVILGTITLIFTLGSGIGSVIVSHSNKIERLEIRSDFYESSDRDRALQLKDMNQQFKEMNQKLTDILVTLQNKEDRPKNYQQ